MIFLLVALLLLTTGSAYFLNHRHIMAPAVVVSGMFLISSTVAMLNLRLWQYQFRFWTVLIIVAAVIFCELGALTADCLVMTRGRVRRLSARRGSSGKITKIRIGGGTLTLLSLLILGMFAYYAVQIYRLSVAFGNTHGVSQMIGYARDAFVARMDISRLANLCSCFSQCAAYFGAFVFLRNCIYFGYRKKELPVLILVALNVPFQVLSGARSGYILFFAYVIVVWVFLYQSKHHWNPKNTRQFILLGAAALAIFLVIFRFSGFLKNSGVGVSAWRSISKYMGFSIAGLNSKLAEPLPTSNYFGEHTLNNVYSVLNQLHITHVTIANPFLQFTKLPGISSNVYSALFLYIWDYGYWGMFAVMFLIGLAFTAANNYLCYSHRRGLALILYATYFYPLVMISIADLVLYGLLSTTTIYQAAFYFLLYDGLVNRRAARFLQKRCPRLTDWWARRIARPFERAGLWFAARVCGPVEWAAARFGAWCAPFFRRIGAFFRRLGAKLRPHRRNKKGSDE